MKTVIAKILGREGHLITASKGQYRWDNPDNLVVFNSNIFDGSGNKLWYGDLDITNDHKKLAKLAKSLKITLYVLSEMDGRFENEKTPDLSKYLVKVDPKNGVELSLSLRQDYDSNFKRLPEEEEEVQEKVLPDNWNNDMAGTEYKKSDFVYLGSLSGCLLRLNKNTDPLDKFYAHFIKKHSLSKDLSVCDLYIATNTEEQLTELCKKWLIKYHGMKEGTYRLHKELSWLPLSMPANFYESIHGPTWAKPNGVYLKKVKKK